MQVSRTPRATFWGRVVVLGVGEALKLEIAGLGLVGRLLLLGFGRWACLGSDLTDPLNGPCQAKRGVGLASIWTTFAIFLRRHRLLPRRQLDHRTMMCPQVTSPAAEGGVGHMWCARHAAALFGFGGALECCAGATVSTMINCPPQHGQGRAMVRGGLSASSGLASLVC